MTVQVCLGIGDWEWLEEGAYLLVLRSTRDDVVHQDGHELRDSVHTSSGSAIWSSITNNSALLLNLLKPLSSDTVDNIEDAKLVGSRSFLEVSEDLLDED